MAGTIKSLLPSLLRWTKAAHPKIFISYRRHGEGAGYGGRIADNLVERFGAEQCFRDVADIESGVDFVKTIQEAVSACEILIVVIGPDWISQKLQLGGRRLDDPRDFVRLEVAAALDRDIRVIPVLVGGATMPNEVDFPEPLTGLARRQAQELSDTRWEYDVEKLLRTIESIGIKPRQAKQSFVSRKWKAISASAAGILMVTAVLAGSLGQSEPDNDAVVLPVTPQVKIEQSAVVDRQQIQHKLAQESNALKDAAALSKKLSVALDQQKREAEARAQEERDKRQQLEQRLKDAESRAIAEAAQTRLNFERATPASMNQEVTPFNGLSGRLQVSWQHEGVVYHALVAANGARGIAAVSFVDSVVGQINVEQDISLLRNNRGAFYVGANPRLAGTAIPATFYAPDIFKLMPMVNGNWTITEVGDQWDHLDKAIVR